MAAPDIVDPPVSQEEAPIQPSSDIDVPGKEVGYRTAIETLLAANEISPEDTVPNLVDGERQWTWWWPATGIHFVQIVQETPDGIVGERYLQRNGNLVHAVEWTEGANDWNVEYFVRNGTVITHESLGLGPTEADDWDPQDIVSRWDQVSDDFEDAQALAAESFPTLEMTATSIGPAQVGMTPEEIIAALGPEYTLSPMAFVGETADPYAVLRNGVDVFWFSIEDNNIVRGMSAFRPNIELADGLRPGMALSEAAAIYGEPVVTFIGFEGGFTFADFPNLAEDIGVSLAPAPDGSSAAAYPDDAEFGDDPVEAVRSNPDALIFRLSIWG